MAIAREEIFGPVLAVMTAGSDDEAVELANDTELRPAGLGLHLATRAGPCGPRASCRPARCAVNCYSEGDITTPFGGYKRSGFGGRDKSLQAFDQYMQTKTIWIDLSDPGPRPRPLPE